MKPAASTDSQDLRKDRLALSVVLLIGAGLLLRSLAGLLSADLRFDTTHLLATGITVPYEDDARRVQFQDGLREDLAAVRGVTAVTFTSHMPIMEPWSDPPVWPADHPPMDSSQERTALRRWVMPGFFTTLGIHQLSGRNLLPTDRLGTPDAMVVNDVFAREFFPGEDPLGKRVMVAGGRNPIDCVVVGVVDSARTEFVGRSLGPSVYLSANQEGLRSLRILIRSTLPPPADHGGDPTARIREIPG